MKACTIAASNYLAQVDVLASSFKEHHPQGEFFVLLVDGGPDVSKVAAAEDRYKILSVYDIDIAADEVERMAMIYDVTEFSTAVKPWLLRHLLSDHAPAVLYFDPDIEIFAPLGDVFELSRQHGIVLTPHSTEPYPRDGLKLDESDVMGAGIYNLGFIGVGQGGVKFLDWWSERLRRDCIIDPCAMRFTDQRWIDFVPSFFDHYLLKDAGCNVAYWNLHGRRVTWNGARYEVNGGPLRFFHFSGYDPEKPHLLSKHMLDRPRVLLSAEPAIARLCEEYRRKLEEGGFSSRRASGYRYDRLANGFVITQAMRRFYRDMLLEAEKAPGEKPFPPSPFAPGGADAFVAWLNEPVIPGQPGFTRYFKQIHDSRPDLHAAFPDPSGKNLNAFLGWMSSSGRREHHIPDALLPSRLPTGDVKQTKTSVRSADADVLGYFRAELGVGEAARLLIPGLEAAGLSCNTISLRDLPSRQNHPFREAEGVSGAKVKILCVNGDMTPVVARRMGSAFFEGCHTIGVWFWELEHFPPAMFAGFHHVDEIWVASEFVAAALRKVSPKPVFAFPLPAPDLRGTPTLTKKELGLPEKFMFLFSFDFFSIFERKNPIGLVRAFTKAFAPGEGPVLVIKSINGDRKLADLEKLRYAAAGRADIVITDGYLPHDRKNALMGACDCYISLHRGEGFGLTMAEAMSLAKPVIATRYGGNMEFMTEQNSYLCGYTTRSVGPGSEPYPPETQWADPDINEAAALMQRVYHRRDEAAARGRLAQEDILAGHSPAACASFVKKRFARIEAGLAAAVRLKPAGDVTDEGEFLDRTLDCIDNLRAMERALDAVADELTVLSQTSRAGGQSGGGKNIL